MRLKHFLSVFLTLLTLSVGQMWGTPTTLFKQTFGNNSGSAANWNASSYSVMSGVEDVYTDAAETITDAKVSKNTMGNGSTSSALVSGQGKTGIYVVGPLDVSGYESLTLTNAFGMSAGSWNTTNSIMRCSYSTTGSSYTAMTRSNTNPSSAVSKNGNYVTATYTVPNGAISTTLYLKFEFYCYQVNKNSQEIGQAYFDDVELKGEAPSCTPLASINGSVLVTHFLSHFYLFSFVNFILTMSKVVLI